ncbi:MAG: hypothetical protein H6Q99_4046, partial [Proteobacteria bacterium]|nr:hypothetical protein [Pseudomonadota bacterium]
MGEGDGRPLESTAGPSLSALISERS